MVAERETSDRLLARYMADQIGARFKGRISGVTRSGLFVRLDETGADGFVPAASLGLDYFRYVEEQSGHDRRADGRDLPARPDRSRCGCSKRRRWPAPCGSKSCPKARGSKPPAKRGGNRRPAARRPNAKKEMSMPVERHHR